MANVLFIEDDPQWQEILSDLLKTAGHQSFRATSIDTAMGFLQSKQKFDIVVFDLQLGTNEIRKNPFVWLDALQDGLNSKKIQIPPIIIVTGTEISKPRVRQIFTSYRGVVLDYFEKSNFDDQLFMQILKSGAIFSQASNSKPKSFLPVVGYTFLMAIIVSLTIGVLLWSVKQIPDPSTQQTFLQIGGALIVIVALFVLIFSQNARIENVIDSITQIWKK